MRSCRSIGLRISDHFRFWRSPWLWHTHSKIIRKLHPQKLTWILPKMMVFFQLKYGGFWYLCLISGVQLVVHSASLGIGDWRDETNRIGSTIQQLQKRFFLCQCEGVTPSKFTGGRVSGPSKSICWASQSHLNLPPPKPTTPPSYQQGRQRGFLSNPARSYWRRSGRVLRLEAQIPGEISRWSFEAGEKGRINGWFQLALGFFVYNCWWFKKSQTTTWDGAQTL